jgi:hypothetical protein
MHWGDNRLDEKSLGVNTSDGSLCCMTSQRPSFAAGLVEGDVLDATKKYK